MNEQYIDGETNVHSTDRTVPSAQKTFSLVRIHSHNLDLNSHVIFTQSRHPNRCPNGRMVRHPLPEIPRHRCKRLIVQGHMVGIDAEDLRPTLSTRVLETQVHIREGLVDLRVDLFVVFASFGDPAAWRVLGRDEMRHGRCTLPRTLDAVADAHGLVVAVFLDGFLALAWVGEVLERRHSRIGCD